MFTVAITIAFGTFFYPNIDLDDLLVQVCHVLR